MDSMMGKSLLCLENSNNGNVIEEREDEVRRRWEQ
jgi:hypothetical protein